MKRLKAVFICLSAASCMGQDSPETNLPLCWNVNDLEAGRFAGQGVFATSMEGLTLLAPNCDDRRGGNSFELAPSASQAFLSYQALLRGDRFIGFSFHGHTKTIGGEKTLIIDHIAHVRGVSEPQWIVDLNRAHAGKGADH